MSDGGKIPGLKGIGPLLIPVFGIVFAVIGLILVLSTFNSGCGGYNGTSVEQKAPATSTSGTGQEPVAFGLPKKAAHYESNTPAHASTLPAPPINVVIDFNFDLAPPSSISVTSKGKEYGTGETVIDDSKLAMRRAVDPQAPDGLYEVAYTACWPDGSCHDGNFQFAIDRSLASTFTDMRNQPEVTIRQSDISFQPDKVIISKGTKATWVNDDNVEHFVNTDSHPAHTYYLPMNSRGLAPGATFSLTFTEPGAYPYHCSAHADQMTGMILVQ